MKEAGEAEGFHSAILERFVRLHSLFYYRLLDWIVCIIRGHSAFIFRVGQVFQYARKKWSYCRNFHCHLPSFVWRLVSVGP